MVGRGLFPIGNLQESAQVESNGHVTDDVTQPWWHDSAHITLPTGLYTLLNFSVHLYI